MAAGIHGEISVKPTQLGLDHDPAACLANILRLAEHAAAAGSFLWIDMEGSAYTEATIALYERVKADQPKTGICLQAYLKRTAADIERLLPLDPAIRLVKGAYDEPAAIAYRDRREVDANYLGARGPVPARRAGKPIRLGLGTHDVALIEQIEAQVRRPASGATPSRSRCSTASARTSSAGWRRRATGADADRLRRALVPVVHAPPRGAAGERDVRDPLDAAVGR